MMAQKSDEPWKSEEWMAEAIKEAIEDGKRSRRLREVFSLKWQLWKDGAGIHELWGRMNSFDEDRPLTRVSESAREFAMPGYHGEIVIEHPDGSIDRVYGPELRPKDIAIKNEGSSPEASNDQPPPWLRLIVEFVDAKDAKGQKWSRILQSTWFHALGLEELRRINEAKDAKAAAKVFPEGVLAGIAREIAEEPDPDLLNTERGRVASCFLHIARNVVNASDGEIRLLAIKSYYMNPSRGTDS
jgi:hypothetical protein